MSSQDEKMRFDSQLSRMNCQTFSTGPSTLLRRALSSGHLGGSGIRGDISWHDQFCRAVPSRLIEQHNGVCTWRDMECDLCQMHAPGYVLGPGCCNGASRYQRLCLQLDRWHRRSRLRSRAGPWAQKVGSHALPSGG